MSSPAAHRIARQPSPARELLEANTRLERRVSELLAVAELAQTLTSELRLDAVLEAALTTAASLTGAQAVSLLLAEPDGVGLVARARRGGECLPAPGERRRSGEGLAGWVARYQVPLLVADLAAQPRFREMALADGLEAGSFIGLPLVFRERLLGVLCAAEKAGGLAFDERDLRILICLAPHLAIAIRNATLHAQLEEQARTARNASAGSPL